MGKKRKKNRPRTSTSKGNEENGKVELLAKLRNLDAKQIVFGFNAVFRLLEKNLLDLVVTASNINSLLRKPINMLCEHHNIPLYSLEHHEVASLNSKIRRITAFGIKKTVPAIEDSCLPHQE